MSAEIQLETRPRLDRCWSEIGVWGNHTCAELTRVMHCHNCPVFSRAGRSLFDRQPPANYVDEWTQLLAKEREAAAGEEQSVMVFRLDSEWLALPTTLLREVAEKRTIHRIPHRTTNVLLGLVNIRGGLQLCISLRDLLGLGKEPGGPPQASKENRTERLAVLAKESDCWVTPVHEIMGIHRLPAKNLQEVPVTVAKASASFTKGIFTWNDKRIGYLDEELVFYHLKRTVL